MPLADGTKIAGYVILRQLGAGGMGEVYLAQHPRLPRQDALKVLRADVSADADFLDRFEREADLAAKLWHPHVVGIHDRGKYRGRLWISMDYVEGTDASRMLHEEYPEGIALQTVMGIVTAVASALDYAHKRGLLHRDVKPANIMLSNPDDGEQRVLLTDFGIARNIDDISGLTATNMTVGTVAYSAPEQLMGEEVDGRADEYALAATAYHLLTGSHLFPHSNPAVVIGQHLNAAPPSLAERHPPLAGLDAVLRKALAKNPKDRFTSCSEFARALADSNHTPSDVSTQWAVATPATMWPASGTPFGPAPMSAVGQPPSVSPKRSGRLLAAAAVFLVLCVAAYLGIRAFNKPEQVEPFTLTGSVQLNSESFKTNGLPRGFDCAGAGGYDDIAPGAAVTVADETGRLLAKGTLESSNRSGNSCKLVFAVRDVPSGAKFYRVQVSHRGEMSYTEAEAKAGIDLPLGSLEPTTTPSTTTSTTTTTRPTTTTSTTPNLQLAAFGRLQALAAGDRSDAATWLAERWVPQLSSKYEGLRAEGTVWDYVAILNEHLQLRQRWGSEPGVLLLWSPDWSTFDKNHGYWVTVAGLYSNDYRDALAWCTSQRRDRDHCFAKLISTTHPVDGTTKYN